MILEIKCSYKSRKKRLTNASNEITNAYFNSLEYDSEKIKDKYQYLEKIKNSWNSKPANLKTLKNDYTPLAYNEIDHIKYYIFCSKNIMMSNKDKISFCVIMEFNEDEFDKKEITYFYKIIKNDIKSKLAKFKIRKKITNYVIKEYDFNKDICGENYKIIYSVKFDIKKYFFDFIIKYSPQFVIFLLLSFIFYTYIMNDNKLDLENLTVQFGIKTLLSLMTSITFGFFEFISRLIFIYSRNEYIKIDEEFLIKEYKSLSKQAVINKVHIKSYQTEFERKDVSEEMIKKDIFKRPI